jgi:hypothetical protein
MEITLFQSHRCTKYQSAIDNITVYLLIIFWISMQPPPWPGQQYPQYQQPLQQQWPQQAYPPQYQQPMPYQHQVLQAELQRNYTPAAWLSAALSFLFVIPGLIATIIYLIEAQGIKKRTGITPQGYGCLWAILIWCLLPMVGVIGLISLLLLGVLASTFH